LLFNHGKPSFQGYKTTSFTDAGCPCIKIGDNLAGFSDSGLQFLFPKWLKPNTEEIFLSRFLAMALY
jgi:hypothetical protein